MALTEKEKRELAKLASPDYGIPGAGFDSLRSGINTAPLPGTNSSLDLLNTARQFLFEASKERRLDDGFRGVRVAKIIYMEAKPFISIPDKYFVKELLSTLPEEERDANLNEIFVIYAIPTGGTTSANVLPEALPSRDAALDVSSQVDLGKIINYPRFYAFKHQIEGTEINPGDFINVEIRDYVEYSYGVFVGLHASSPMISAGGLPGSGELTPGVVGAPGTYQTGPGTGFTDTGAKIKYSISSYNLDNSGGFIGATARRDGDSPKTDPIPDAMAASNGSVAGKSKYGAIYQPFRKDVAEHFNRAIAELRAQGGKFYGCGALMNVASQATRAARKKRGGSPLSLHYLGRAIDLHTGAGCMMDSKAISSLRKVGWNANATPAYGYYISPNGKRRWSVYAVSDDPSVPQTQILAVFAGWSGGSDIFCEKVTGRFIDLTKVFAKHGFAVIRAHNGLTPKDHIEQECMGPNNSAALSEGGFKTKFTNKWSSAYSHLEWWHFQFIGDLVKGQTTWGSQLQAIMPMENILKGFGPPTNVRYWGRRNDTWDSPRATYLKYWG